MGNPQRYSRQFQERAVRRMKLGENVSQLARELGVDRTCLYAWKRKLGREPYGRVRGKARSNSNTSELRPQACGRQPSIRRLFRLLQPAALKSRVPRFH